MKHFATLGGVLTESAMELIRRNILQINTIVRKAFPRDRDVKKAYQVCSTRYKIYLIIYINNFYFYLEIKYNNEIFDSAPSI